MNLITLAIIIATRDHLDKIVLNPGLGTWVKRRDNLLAQLKLSINLIEFVASDTVAEMIRNQDDSNNNIFDFSLDLE